MKKVIAAFIAVISAATVSAQPDKDWWACQFIESVGLRKQGTDGWNHMKFNLDAPFVLISDGNDSLTEESAAKAMGWVESSCNTRTDNLKFVTCTTETGKTLFFWHQTGKGGIADLEATAVPGSVGDAKISPFTCTKG